MLKSWPLGSDSQQHWVIFSSMFTTADGDRSIETAQCRRHSWWTIGKTRWEELSVCLRWGGWVFCCGRNNFFHVCVPWEHGGCEYIGHHHTPRVGVGTSCAHVKNVLNAWMALSANLLSLVSILSHQHMAGRVVRLFITDQIGRFTLTQDKNLSLFTTRSSEMRKHWLCF